MRVIARAAAVGAVFMLSNTLLQSPASAIGGTTCREVSSSGTKAVVCVWDDVSQPQSTTVTLYVGAACATFKDGHEGLSCEFPDEELGETGFVPNPGYTPPTVTPNGDVIVYAGTLGTLYVNGWTQDVNTPDLCLGDPAACP